MDTGIPTASSIGKPETLRNRIVDWVILDGSRHVVAAGIVALVVGFFTALVWADVVAVGVGSSVDRAFGSGLTAGVVTLVTIALSINQLILSRVFGSPGQLRDRLDGARTLRTRVMKIAGEPSSPNDPAAFLSLLARTIDDRATATRRAVERGSQDSPEELTGSLSDIAEYGRSIDEHVEEGTPIVDVLSIIVGSEYATNMTAVQHLHNVHEESLPAEANAQFEALSGLFESLAVVRQFFKTLAVQQDFAMLSRLLVYTGLLGLLASLALTLVYSTDAVAIDPSLLPVIVPIAFGIAITPLAVFSAYVLRAATVAYRTVSVGPFVPPDER
jgi:hypothetical protein